MLRAFAQNKHPLSNTTPSILSITNSSVTHNHHHHHHLLHEQIPRGFESTSTFYIDHERNTINDPVNNPRSNTLKTERGPASATSWRQECFSCWPQIATDDTLNDDALRMLNNKVTWFVYCQRLIEQVKSERKQTQHQQHNAYDSDDDYDYNPSITLSNSSKQEPFHFGFPLVLNFPEKLHHRTLHFSLSSEQLKNSDLLTQLDNTGYLTLKLDQNSVLHLADAENLIGEKFNGNVRYHWKVLHLMIVQEHNRLPIEMDIQLTTPVPDSGSRVQWISASGISPKGLTHYVTVPGVKRISKADQQPLYIADIQLNSCDATRWLEVDERAFEVSLQKMKQGTNYVIPMPEEKHYVASDPVQFLVVSEFRRIVELCKYYKLQDLPQVEKDGSRYFAVVPQTVLNLIANEKWSKYDKRQHLMRVEDFELTLTPAKDNWREDFESYINRYSKFSNSENAVPQFSIKIEIAYENYTGNKQFRGTTKLHHLHLHQQQQQQHQQQNDLILSPQSNNGSSSSSSIGNNNNNSYKISTLYG